MNVEEFDIKNKYSGKCRAMNQDFDFIFIPIKAKPGDDSIIVIIINDRGESIIELDDSRWVGTIKELQSLGWEQLSTYMNHPDNADDDDEVEYIGSSDMEYLEKWDYIKGKYISPYDTVVTSINTIGTWEENKKPVKKAIKPAEGRDEEEMIAYKYNLAELTPVQQAICETIANSNPYEWSHQECWRQIRHAIITCDENMAHIIFYSGAVDEWDNEELEQWGYYWEAPKRTFTEEQMLEKVKAAYSYGVATISEATVSDIPKLLRDSNAGKESCAREILDWYYPGNKSKGA